MNRLLRYLTLPSEISPFERTYLARMNRIALGFFWLHLPVFVGIALLAGTPPVRVALLTAIILVGPTLASVALADRPRLVSCIHAITAMMMGGVLVYAGQGPLQIEMHFYFFVLIALLAVFANPLVIVIAAATAAAHHLLVWLWLPHAVFNYDASFWTVVVHAAFVVLESVAACFVARSFFDNVIGLEQIVRARTAQVDQRNHDMALILDNVAQGFVTIDLHGELGAERSSILDRWFGVPRPGATLFDHFVPGDDHTQGWFELGLSDLRDGLMPPELVIEQLPRQLTAGERRLQLQYRPIGEPIHALLVVVTDITGEMARQRAEASTRELFAAVEKARGDRSGFEAFITEADQLVRRCTTAQATLMSELKRELHTLKGNAGLFGVTSVAEICHDIESTIEEEQRFPDAASTERLESAWRDFHSRIDPLLGLSRERTVVVGYQEYRSLLAQVPSPEPRWVEQLRRWGLDATRPHLERFAEQARGLAERLGKPDLQVTVEDGDVRIEGERFAKLWSALVHAVRNAVDHGLEAPDVRVDAGKPASGHLVLASRIVDDTLHVEVRDDGRGIDWARVRACRRRAARPARDHPRRSRRRAVHQRAVDRGRRHGAVRARRRPRRAPGRVPRARRGRDGAQRAGPGHPPVLLDPARGRRPAPPAEHAQSPAPPRARQLSAPSSSSPVPRTRRPQELTMSRAHGDHLRSLLAVSAHELFAAYQVTSADADAVEGEVSGLCCVLGFTGGTLAGSVVITADDPALAASNPLRDGPTRDWIAELTNQVVGRFKNALLRRGVDVGMSLPVVLRAVRLVPVPSRTLMPVALEVGGGMFHLWLDLEFGPEFTISEAVSLDLAGAEGETFMF